MGHGYKHRVVKAELIGWLSDYEDCSLWQDLASSAGKNWVDFAKCVKKAWQHAGGNAGDLNFLDNKQHCVQVWQVVNGEKKKNLQQHSLPSRRDRHHENKAELMEWLWYYDGDQFWQDLVSSKKIGWKAFAARIKSEWKSAGGQVGLLNFLDNSQHCMAVYNVVFQSTQPQLPRQPALRGDEAM